MKLIIEIDEKMYEKIMHGYVPLGLSKYLMNGTPLPQCKNCKYFEYDSVAKVDGIPLIVAHEICNRWGDGCKSRENGYCFLFEQAEEVIHGGFTEREVGLNETHN